MAHPETSPRSLKKIIASAMIGNALEWYDYALYGFMTPIISKLFFPSVDSYVGLLATFGIFAVGFAMRPLGAILFGYIGDKHGRRRALVIAILMMAIPTGCIGLLPTYAQIGILAPVLLTLLRLVQGLSLGGEFSGAIIYVTEHASRRHRGIAGSTALISLVVGFLGGSLFYTALSSAMNEADFTAWGWRIPFLLGVVVGMIGLYIRTHCEESPCYVEAKENNALAPKPLREAFLEYPKEMLIAVGAYMLVTLPFYMLSIYFVTFTKVQLGLSLHDALLINAGIMLTFLVGFPFSAWISDFIGRKKMLIIGAVLALIAALPLFKLIIVPEFATTAAGQILLAAVMSFYLGSVPTMLVELFPTRVRYTGMAFSYNVAAAAFGGTAPMLCTWLINKTGDNYSIAWTVIVSGVVALLSLAFYKDRSHEELQ